MSRMDRYKEILNDQEVVVEEIGKYHKLGPIEYQRSCAKKFELLGHSGYMATKYGIKLRRTLEKLLYGKSIN